MEKTLKYLLCVLAITMIVLMYIECVTKMNIYANYTFCTGVFVMISLITYPIYYYYYSNDDSESNKKVTNSNNNSVSSDNSISLMSSTIPYDQSILLNLPNDDLTGLDEENTKYYTVDEHRLQENNWKEFQKNKELNYQDSTQ